MRGKPRPAGAELTAEVADLSHEGRGIARIDGKVTFIRGALPGERVRYRLYRHGKQADEGELSAIEQASPERVEPGCKHFGVCGGCSMQHLSAAGQVAFKQKQLLDALERIGKVVPGEVAPAVTGEPWGYRRRARCRSSTWPRRAACWSVSARPTVLMLRNSSPASCSTRAWA